MDAMEELLNAIKFLNDALHNLDPDYIKDVTTNMKKGLKKVAGTPTKARQA